MMKALSVMQPWAWMMIHQIPDRNGKIKDIENRPWRWNYKGPLLIHAAKKYDWFNHHIIESWGIAIPKDLPRGGLVGLVTMDGTIEESESPYFFGPYGFLFLRPIPFKEMVPCAGRQRVFNVDFTFEVEIGAGVSMRGEVTA